MPLILNLLHSRNKQPSPPRDLLCISAGHSIPAPLQHSQLHREVTHSRTLRRPTKEFQPSSLLSQPIQKQILTSPPPNEQPLQLLSPIQRHPVQHLCIASREAMKDQTGKRRSILRPLIQGFQSPAYPLSIDPPRHPS